jgi:enamine deaminase RidA (YjgF/YER057c/UK114 family)
MEDNAFPKQRTSLPCCLENIEMLLSNQGAHLSDLKQAVVYLRDPSDGARARTLGHFF